jgi:hypothetical protein
MLALFTAVIIIWWAVWWLFDEYLFHYLLPNDRTLAYVIGIIIWIFIIYLNDYDLEDFLG